MIEFPIRHSGHKFVFLIEPETVGRLSEKHFPQTLENVASQFTRWKKVSDLFIEICQNEELLPKKVHELAAIRRMMRVFEIDFDQPIGCADTDVRSKYKIDDLEEHTPNKSSQVMRVKPSRTDLKAPLTKKLSVRCEVNPKKNATIVIILNFYPGPSIGPIKGDITESRGIVMFAPNHPGES